MADEKKEKKQKKGKGARRSGNPAKAAQQAQQAPAAAPGSAFGLGQADDGADFDPGNLPDLSQYRK